MSKGLPGTAPEDNGRNRSQSREAHFESVSTTVITRAR